MTYNSGNCDSEGGFKDGRDGSHSGDNTDNGDESWRRYLVLLRN